MSPSSSWQFDEMKHVGTDYSEVSEVEIFDDFHRQFRDVQKENEAIIRALSIQPNHRGIDFGAGTGAFAIQAAACSQEVYAVDISRGMLFYARTKAEARGISNIHFCHGGFLTYEHTDAPVDFIVTSLALHHLPDFWKGIALRRLNAMLETEGRFFLSDVVYSGDDCEQSISVWMSTLENTGGKALVEDARIHVQSEYSTYAWVMTSLIEKAGFRIDRVDYDQGVLAQYLCTKITEGVK
ncbi:MAG: class I SAM-dependent methyltransferase [Nitrospirota bacterium]|nr:class I SAM-dependent methyltransferase [Nitrospirota bacterium]